MEYIALNREHKSNYSVINNHGTINISINRTIPFNELKNIISKFKGLEDIYDGKIIPGNISINLINDNFLFVHKSKLLLIVSYKDKTIAVNRQEREFLFITGNEAFSSIQMDDRSGWMKKVLIFLNELEEIKEKNTNKVLYDLIDIYDDLRIYNEKRYNTIIENNEIKLVNHLFRDPNSPWQKLSIIDSKSNDIVGYIEFNLSDNNFSYSGNVSYEIYSKFQNKGYATKALELIKVLVGKYQDCIDKNLYIATVLENIYSQRVALNCGASLYYEGDVPKSDKLFFLGKVNKVKIYKIDIE